MKIQTNSVSVVIPVFNGALFIKEIIESILIQESVLVEIIVVNDGSTDDTVKIAQNILNDSNVGFRIIEQENKGVSSARNNGLNHASKDFVCFVDADDIWRRDNLIKKLNYLNSHDNCTAVTSYCEIINEKGERTGVVKKADKNVSLNDLLQWKGNYITIPSGIVFRRSQLLKLGGFDEQLSNNADQDILLRLLHFGFKFNTLQEVTWYYRMHESNMSKKIDLMERDTTKVFTKAIELEMFSGLLFQRKCFSKMAMIVGLSWLVNAKKYDKAVKWLVLSFYYSPINFTNEILTRLFRLSR